MVTLFEYGEWQQIKDPVSLERLLNQIWQDRLLISPLFSYNSETTDKQPFLQINGSKIKANNYIGFIQNQDELIEIYPKVFKTLPHPLIPAQKQNMISHILYWLSYCRRWNFPFNNALLDKRQFDSLPELIIYLIAKQFQTVVSTSPINLYQPTSEVMQSPKGSINFKRYLNNGFARGNMHQLDCDYEPFIFDNQLNRLIKYCTRLLLAKANYIETIQLLQDVLFILDEIEDVSCSLHDADVIKLSSFHQEYKLVVESCKIVLSHHVYDVNDYSTQQWSLLLPMDYVFEDFVAGFLESRFSKSWIITYQKSDLYLTSQPRAFQMKHDLYLEDRGGNGRCIIIDTKYKLRPADFKSDNKKGVNQNDLYQVLSYAFRRGVKEVILMYPNIGDNILKTDLFEIESGFNSDDKISVTIVEIPFWSSQVFNKEKMESMLEDTFSELL